MVKYAFKTEEKNTEICILIQNIKKRILCLPGIQYRQPMKNIKIRTLNV